MANPFFMGPGGPVYMMGGMPPPPQQIPIPQGFMMQQQQPPVAPPPPKQAPVMTEEKLQEKGAFMCEIYTIITLYCLNATFIMCANWSL